MAVVFRPAPRPVPGGADVTPFISPLDSTFVDVVDLLESSRRTIRETVDKAVTLGVFASIKRREHVERGPITRRTELFRHVRVTRL